MKCLYHSTSEGAALEIEAKGFVESHFAGIASGVFLADRPITAADGAASAFDVVFAVNVPNAFALDEYELVEEGRPADAYREWLIPAAIVNAWPRQRHVEDDDWNPAPQRP